MASIHPEGYLGVAGLADQGAGMAAGAEVLVRYRLLEGGPQCHFLGAIVRVSGCGGLLGISYRRGRSDVALLGAFGRRFWDDFGSSGIFSGPGANATLWYAGGRAGATWFYGAFALGFWLGVDADIGRKHVVYDVPQLLGQSSTGEADVGGVTVFGAVRLGVNFDAY